MPWWCGNSPGSTRRRGLHVHQRAGRVFRYLRGTINHKLTYRRDATARFYGSADADWAGEWETARSTTGWAFSGGSGALSWSAATQKLVTHSSTEAELVALDSYVRELQYLRALLADFRIDTGVPVEIFQDTPSLPDRALAPVRWTVSGRYRRPMPCSERSAQMASRAKSAG